MARIDDVAKNFVPKEREGSIYQEWLAASLFHPVVDPEKKPYTIVMPPPNITGQLHIGHALDLSCQDILIRAKRMQGYNALYLPGTDHASIATEARIVNSMRKEGLTKDDLGRDGFMKRAWAWKAEYGSRIEEQVRQLGVSCDWERLRFTMDEGLSEAVQEVFVRLYEQKLIYRGERMVNWCSTCLTSISDAEVEHEEKDGKFWHIRYPLADGSGELILATTRPETLLGDTAVAVHPDDERYNKLIGQTVILPLVGRLIPIVGDTYVDPEFGTGVVKITPAHDPNDFEVGLRHDLPIINVMNEDGTINEEGAGYTGLSRYDARKKIVADLNAGDYLVRTEEMKHKVGCCYRCSTEIEPRVSLQWFVNMQELSDKAIAAVKEGEIRFIPERFDKPYLHWMENIRDWCISRQLWWGHRIPAWYCDQCGEITVDRKVPEHCVHCGSTRIRQDEDTLDTWFSSALWPFSTLGWPNETEDFKYFYPTDCLVTGYDIITFWVSRMIFSGLEYTGQKPFSDVLIHGLVRDEQGRKMSKSLGNGIDPIEVIEQYGADALRYALISGTSPGNDLRYSSQKLEAGRNFINKIWNAFRFSLMNFEEDTDFSDVTVDDFVTEDRWILGKLEQLISELTQNLEQYELGIGLGKIYTFLWDNFCDWYIEMVKPRLRQKDSRSAHVARFVLNEVLCETLTLLHPYLPFVTEEIFRYLIHEPGLLAARSWPRINEAYCFPKEAELVSTLIDIVRGVRNVRAEMNVPPKQKINLLLLTEAAELSKMLEESGEILAHLAGIEELQICASSSEVPKTAVALTFVGGSAFIPLESLVDLETERKKLQAEIAKYDEEICKIETKLENAEFVQKAPEAVVNRERERLNAQKEMRNSACRRLEDLK